MAKVSEMIQSKFLKKDDFPAPRVLTIKDVSLEEVGQNGDTKWVLFFKELTKGMVMAVTTIRTLENAYGDDSENWSGKRVQIYVDPDVTYGGRVVGALRLRTKAAPPPPPPPPAREPGSDDELDDSADF